MSKDNGGPAFPTGEVRSTQSKYRMLPGMSLRDYFAAKAIKFILDGEALDDMPLDAVPDVVASCAYAIADAMLAERAK